MMIRKIAHTLLGAALAVTAAGCDGTSNIDDDIEVADYAADTQQYDEALQICNSLAENQKISLNDRQLGRLSIVYMKLSELADEEENVARATHCYSRGLEVSADSLREFYHTLSIDDTRHFDLLAKIGRSLAEPCEIMEDDTIDAMTMVPEQMEP